MKRKLIITLLAVSIFSMFSVTGSAFAQSDDPVCPGDCTEPNEMIMLISEKLGMSVEELQTRLENGERLAQIAISAGMSFDDFRALMPTDKLGQSASGMFGQGNQRVSGGTMNSPFGSSACLDNPDCAPQYFGQQPEGRGIGRAR